MMKPYSNSQQLKLTECCVITTIGPTSNSGVNVTDICSDALKHWCVAEWLSSSSIHQSLPALWFQGLEQQMLLFLYSENKENKVYCETLFQICDPQSFTFVQLMASYSLTSPAIVLACIYFSARIFSVNHFKFLAPHVITLRFMLTQSYSLVSILMN